MRNAINPLILLAIIAWLLQIVLGWRQINRFNRAFGLLSKRGTVGIGRTQGRLKAKVVIALAFDENRRVADSLMMKGGTVFSKPQPVPALQGLHYDEIRPQAIFPNDKNAREALTEALRLK